jgi:predicted phage terminase large subunit-like protein
VARSAFGHHIRTKDLFEVVGHKGSYRSAGVGGGITGMGFTLGIIDDPLKNRKEADSPTIRQGVWDFWTNDFSTRKGIGARILVIMTRWHRDDLAGRLIKAMQEQGTHQWEVLSLPGIMPAESKHESDPRQTGEALWPYFMDEAAHKKEQTEDRQKYAALYDQNPGEAGGTEWPTSYFGSWIWCEPERWPDSFDKFALRSLALDPSKGKSDKHGDYSAIVFVGVKDGLVYVDANLERRPPHQIVRDMLTMAAKYRPQFVGIEANQFQELLVHEFELQCGQRFTDTLGVHATPMVNTIPKIVRIRRLGPYIVNREFRFKRDSPGCHLLVDQLMDFPNADHDDGPDALEMAIRLPGDIGDYE